MGGTGIVTELAAVAAVAASRPPLRWVTWRTLYGSNAISRATRIALRDLALLLRGVAGDPAGADLGALGHEPAEQVDVLVVDPR